MIKGKDREERIRKKKERRKKEKKRRKEKRKERINLVFDSLEGGER